MSDFGIMQTRILDEINRNDLTSQTRLAIKSSIQHYESEKFWFNLQRSTAPTVADQEYYQPPSDFIDVDSLLMEVNSRTYQMQPRTYFYIDSIYVQASTYTGYPTEYAIYDKQIRLYPVPDDSYTMHISYLRELPDVSASADTSAWFTDGELLIRSRAKWDLYQNVLRQYDHAQAMSQAEGREFDRILSRTNKYNTSGRLTPSL